MYSEPKQALRSPRAFVFGGVGWALLFAVCAFAADSVPAPIYKAYSDAAAKPYAVSISKLEQQFHVLTAPGPLTGLKYVDYPQPFDLDLRRGRTNLKLVAFVVTDASGKLIQLCVIGASDMTVARVAGEKLSHVKWHPAHLDAVPVASAGIWEFEGAGIPNQARDPAP